MSSKAAFAN
jgi:hypothetical protein